MTRARRATILSYAILILAGFLSLFPILWIMGISLKTQADAFAMPPKLIFVPIWDHYAKVWGDAAFIKGFFNSVFAALLGNLMAFVIGIPAAFALNQRRVPARGAIRSRLNWCRAGSAAWWP
jgi:ABC-type glycerol-3-phosphate transport system permease component